MVGVCTRVDIRVVCVTPANSVRERVKDRTWFISSFLKVPFILLVYIFLFFLYSSLSYFFFTRKKVGENGGGDLLRWHRCALFTGRRGKRMSAED